MTPKQTLRALDASTRHWERLVKLTRGEFPGGDQCALCDKFMQCEPYCQGCPIAEKTGETRCKGTPYENAFEAFIQDTVSDRAKIAAAKAELAFLRKVRQWYVRKYPQAESKKAGKP